MRGAPGLRRGAMLRSGGARLRPRRDRALLGFAGLAAPLQYVLPVIRVCSGATGNSNYVSQKKETLTNFLTTSCHPPPTSTPRRCCTPAWTSFAGGSGGRHQEYLQSRGTQAVLFFRFMKLFCSTGD